MQILSKNNLDSKNNLGSKMYEGWMLIVSGSAIVQAFRWF
jgi:hypothetical protein